MRTKLSKILRIVVPIVVIGWLLTTIDPAQVAELRSRPKQWHLLAAGLGLSFTAVCLTFVRWYLLVRVAGLSLTLRDAFRLSFLGVPGELRFGRKRRGRSVQSGKEKVTATKYG